MNNSLEEQLRTFFTGTQHAEGYSWKKVPRDIQVNHDLYGIKGWALALLLYLVLAPTFGVLMTLSSWHTLELLNPHAFNDLHSAIEQNKIIYFVFVIWAYWIAYLIWTKQDFQMLFLVWSLSIITFKLMEPSLGLKSAFDESEPVHVINALLATLILTPLVVYVFRSRRINVTFDSVLRHDDPLRNHKYVKFPLSSKPTCGGGGRETPFLVDTDDATPTDLANATDDYLWGIALVETKDEKQKKGLWGRLFVENDGDETKTKVAYLKERFDELKADREESIKTARAEAEAKAYAQAAAEAEQNRIGKEFQLAYKATKRPDKEEHALLQRLRPYSGEVSLINSTPQQVTGQKDELKRGLSDGDSKIILKYLANGMRPNSIRIIANDAGIDLHSSEAAMVQIKRYLTVAERLWKKDLLSSNSLHTESGM